MDYKYNIIQFAFINLTVVVAMVVWMFCYAGKPANKLARNGQGTNKNSLTVLNKATGWINSKELTPSDLRGKVVLINFCTYTCINWLRTLPYLQAWSEKYKDQGLVVIGIHTPEFEFEKKPDNVLQAIRDRKIGYAIATDNNREIWNGFENNYWPAFYFIDANGNIRHQQFGEGNYGESEKIIQQLLKDAGAKNIDQQLVSVNAVGVEAAADWSNLLSQENYFGADRTENFTAELAPIEPGQWTITGDWTKKKNNIQLNKPNGKIIYRFHARDVHVVMGPSNSGSVIRYRVLIDGKPAVTAHGTDTDDQGYGKITAQRLYQLIRQTGNITDHLFEIEFLDAGVEAFSITFG